MATNWVYPNVGTADEWSMPGWLPPAGLTGVGSPEAELTFSVPTVVTSFAAPTVVTSFTAPTVVTTFTISDPEGV